MSKIYWNNSYWMSYIKFEQRVIELSHIISFDDNQMSVYSNEIADLILSVMSKVESVLKDIYERNIYPYEFDNQIAEQYSDSYFFKEKVESKKRTKWTLKKCLNALNSKVGLDKKYLTLRENFFRFNNYSNNIIPFGYLDGKGNILGGKFAQSIWVKEQPKFEDVSWLDAYNSLKHDYSNSVKENGTLMNLVFSLSALYLLIIYIEFYRSKRYVLSVRELDNYHSETLGSNLFSISIFNDSTPSFFIRSLDRQMKMYGEGIENSTLLIVEHPKTYQIINDKINKYKEKNPTVKTIDLDRFINVNVDKNSEEFKLYQCIVLLHRKYSKHRLVILNEGNKDYYDWLYTKQKIVINDERFINKTNQFISNIKINDSVEVITLNNELIKGKLVDINNDGETLVIQTEEEGKYSFPKNNIKRARII